MEQSFGTISKRGGDSSNGQYYLNNFQEENIKKLIFYFYFFCRNNVENNTGRNNHIFKDRKWDYRNGWYNECGKISDHIQSKALEFEFIFLKTELICWFYLLMISD